MRIRTYIVAVALCAPLAAKNASLAQTQQTSGRTSAVQSANGSQQKSPDAKQGSAQSDSGKTKPVAKPAIVFTNDNLDASAANGKVPRTSRPRAPGEPIIWRKCTRLPPPIPRNAMVNARLTLARLPVMDSTAWVNGTSN